MREVNSSTQGLLCYDKSDKTFSCDASDLECAGVTTSFFSSFDVTIKENSHRKTFFYKFEKKDEEGEVQYWIYQSKDNFKFMIFND